MFSKSKIDVNVMNVYHPSEKLFRNILSCQVLTPPGWQLRQFQACSASVQAFTLNTEWKVISSSSSTPSTNSSTCCHWNDNSKVLAKAFQPLESASMFLRANDPKTASADSHLPACFNAFTAALMLRRRNGQPNSVKARCHSKRRVHRAAAALRWKA